MEKYFEYLYTVNAAMKLLESIPDDVYPGFNEEVTDAFNALDTATDYLSWVTERLEELLKRSASS